MSQYNYFYTSKQKIREKRVIEKEPKQNLLKDSDSKVFRIVEARSMNYCNPRNSMGLLSVESNLPLPFVSSQQHKKGKSKKIFFVKTLKIFTITFAYQLNNKCYQLCY